MASSASARNGRDSNPKYLGVKAYDGELLKAGVILNRKMLSEIAIQDPAGFKTIVEIAKKA